MTGVPGVAYCDAQGAARPRLPEVQGITNEPTRRRWRVNAPPGSWTPERPCYFSAAQSGYVDAWLEALQHWGRLAALQMVECTEDTGQMAGDVNGAAAAAAVKLAPEDFATRYVDDDEGGDGENHVDVCGSLLPRAHLDGHHDVAPQSSTSTSGDVDFVGCICADSPVQRSPNAAEDSPAWYCAEAPQRDARIRAAAATRNAAITPGQKQAGHAPRLAVPSSGTRCAVSRAVGPSTVLGAGCRAPHAAAAAAPGSSREVACRYRLPHSTCVSAALRHPGAMPLSGDAGSASQGLGYPHGGRPSRRGSLAMPIPEDITASPMTDGYTGEEMRLSYRRVMAENSRLISAGCRLSRVPCVPSQRVAADEAPLGPYTSRAARTAGSSYESCFKRYDSSCGGEYGAHVDYMGVSNGAAPAQPPSMAEATAQEASSGGQMDRGPNTRSPGTTAGSSAADAAGDDDGNNTAAAGKLLWRGPPNQGSLTASGKRRLEGTTNIEAAPESDANSGDESYVAEFDTSSGTAADGTTVHMKKLPYRKAKSSGYPAGSANQIAESLRPWMKEIYWVPSISRWRICFSDEKGRRHTKTFTPCVYGGVERAYEVATEYKAQVDRICQVRDMSPRRRLRMKREAELHLKHKRLAESPGEMFTLRTEYMPEDELSHEEALQQLHDDVSLTQSIYEARSVGFLLQPPRSPTSSSSYKSYGSEFSATAGVGADASVNTLHTPIPLDWQA